MDARLTATVTTKGALQASKELNTLSNSAKSAESNIVKFDKSAKKATSGFSALGRSSGQAGIQIQQFVGQVQGGQSAMVALSQQSADLGFVLGAPLVGAVVGITASVVGMALAFGEADIAMVSNEDAVKTLIGSYDDLNIKQQELTRKLLTAEIKKQELAIKALTAQQLDYETSLNIFTSLDERSAKVNQFTSNIIANELALSKNKEKLDELNGVGMVFNDVNAEAEERITNLVASTIHMANTYGLSTKELFLYKAGLIGANEVQKEAIRIQFDRIDALKAAEEAEKKSLDDDRGKKKLQRRKDAAQRELETILNLNNSELEAIQALEDKRIEKAAASYAQQLISFQEFQAAKTEIEKNSLASRLGLLQESENTRLAREQKALETTKANISSVSDSLIDAAVSGESMGEAVRVALIGISKQVIKSGVDMLVNELLVDKVASAAFLSARTAEVTSTVAQAGLNAFAATAAIPIVGPALAPAAAAAATGAAASLGAPVIAAASAREQGGSLSAGQASTFSERGQLEILTPSSSSRIRTKQQMKQLMGEGESQAPAINIVNIDQSSGGVDIETSTDDDGRIIQLIRDTTSLDAANANSEFRKSMAANTTLEARR